MPSVRVGADRGSTAGGGYLAALPTSDLPARCAPTEAELTDIPCRFGTQGRVLLLATLVTGEAVCADLPVAGGARPAFRVGGYENRAASHGCSVTARCLCETNRPHAQRGGHGYPCWGQASLGSKAVLEQQQVLSGEQTCVSGRIIMASTRVPAAPRGWRGPCEQTGRYLERCIPLDLAGECSLE